jgi:DNA-binding transcriptional LysR family regulator
MPHARIRHYLKHGTLPQLKVFEAVARLGSYTRAAEELYMAQPTVSVHIKKLTETIGLPLFEHVGTHLYLTDAGRELNAMCRSLFSVFEEVEDKFTEMRGLERGQLRLAVSRTGQYFAPRLLAGFIQKHPGIEVSLHIHTRQALIDAFDRNEDDLYLFADPPESLDIVMQKVLANPLVVFARADHPLAGARRIPFARLADEPFLVRETGSSTRTLTQQLFEQHGLTARIRMQLGTNEAIIQAILAGLGVSILSRYTLGLGTDLSELAVLDVDGFPLERHWYFAYPTGKQLSIVASAFLDFVRGETAKLIAGPAAAIDLDRRPPKRLPIRSPAAGGFNEKGSAANAADPLLTVCG